MRVKDIRSWIRKDTNDTCTKQLWEVESHPEQSPVQCSCNSLKDRSLSLLFTSAIYSSQGYLIVVPVSLLLDCPTQNSSWTLDFLPFKLGFTLWIFVKISLVFQMKYSGWRRQRSANELIPPLKKLKKSKTHNWKEETDDLSQKFCFFLSLCLRCTNMLECPQLLSFLLLSSCFPCTCELPLINTHCAETGEQSLVTACDCMPGSAWTHHGLLIVSEGLS